MGASYIHVEQRKNRGRRQTSAKGRLRRIWRVVDDARGSESGPGLTWGSDSAGEHPKVLPARDARRSRARCLDVSLEADARRGECVPLGLATGLTDGLPLLRGRALERLRDARRLHLDGLRGELHV